jgi:hypothetical protein
MSILVPSIPDAPLNQGDILVDVAVAIAGDSGPKTRLGKVMVLSRPCNAKRDAEITVASIAACDLGELQHLETFEDYVNFFQDLRDGRDRPDTFYLGEFEANSLNRFVAKLDRIHTITIPTDDAERALYLSNHRRYTLDSEFRKDLHQRLFRAFASLGFDDEKWWTNSDLAYLIGQGERYLALQLAEIEDAKASMPTIQMASTEKRAENKTNERVRAAEKRKRDVEGLLEPLRLEQQRRKVAAEANPNATLEQ